jgi:hypothetical protein
MRAVFTLQVKWQSCLKKSHDNDDDDNIKEYGPPDHELTAFKEMQLKSTQDDETSDEEDLYN